MVEIRANRADPTWLWRLARFTTSRINTSFDALLTASRRHASLAAQQRTGFSRFHLRTYIQGREIVCVSRGPKCIQDVCEGGRYIRNNRSLCARVEIVAKLSRFLHHCQVVAFSVLYRIQLGRSVIARHPPFQEDGLIPPVKIVPSSEGRRGLSFDFGKCPFSCPPTFFSALQFGHSSLELLWCSKLMLII